MGRFFCLQKLILSARKHAVSLGSCGLREVWGPLLLGRGNVQARGEAGASAGPRKHEGKPHSSHSAASHCGVREAGGARTSHKAAVSEGAGASDEHHTLVLHLLQGLLWKLSSCRPHHPGPPRSGPAHLLMLLKPTSSASLHSGGSEPALSLWDGFPSLPTVSSLQPPACNSSLHWLCPYPSQIPSVVSL